MSQYVCCMLYILNFFFLFTNVRNLQDTDLNVEVFSHKLLNVDFHQDFVLFTCLQI